MIKGGPYKSRNRPGGGSGDGIGSSNLDSPPPRLVSSRQERREKNIRDELSGEKAKEARSKVTLAKFSWDK